ncbi:MAG: phosphocholine cytidylyltransferase family protein [Myxococcota bacterium]|nr:phosphocholine cytidylyltransferase family protein [Myxococcota bacterium]
MKAVILAAGVGSRLAPLTNDRPKVLVEVLGTPIIFRQLDHLAKAGIHSRDVVVVGGYRIDALKAALKAGGYECQIVLNEKYEPWGNFFSLQVAEPLLRGHAFLQLDGDVIMDDKILPRLIAAPGEALLATDPTAELDDDAMKVQLEDGRVVGLDKKLDPKKCMGEYIGVTKLSAAAGAAVFKELAQFPARGLTHEYYDHAYHLLSQRRTEEGGVPFGIVDIADCTVLEIDDRADLERVENKLREQQ